MSPVDVAAPMTAAARYERDRIWSRSIRVWDLGVALLCAVQVVALLLLPSTADRTLWSFVALVVIVAGYLLLGRPGRLRGSMTMVHLYLFLLVVGTALSSNLTGSGFVLLFVSFSHIWFMSRQRWQALVWCVVQTVAVIGGSAVQAGSVSAAWAGGGASMLGALAFSIVTGLWITDVTETSEGRAELLDRLRATQDDLAASERAAGVIAERERLAQEIHDTLAQGFTSVVMLAQTATALLARDRPDEAADRLAQIERVARDNLAEARALVAASGPVALQDATLDEALARLADRFTAETGVPVQVDLDPAVGTDAEAAVVLLRGAQEALANVRRHAAAATVGLTLHRVDGDVVLEVVDDGRGLPPRPTEGVGLTGMRERAAAAGGTVELGPTPGSGTRLRLSLPVRS